MNDDPVMQMTVRRVLEQERRAVLVHWLESVQEPDYLTMVIELGASANLSTAQSGPGRNAVPNS